MSRNEYFRQYNAKRKDRIKERDQARTPAQNLLRSSKDRAHKYSIPHNLELCDIIVPSNCPICDVKLEPAPGSRGGASHSPSLDKVRPELGYIKGNVAVLCKKCNSMKGDATPDLLRRIADYIEAHIN